jgi:hypothetical protein
MTHMLFGVWLSIKARLRDERGDVPGWVMVTLMSAGLVAAIWALARGELQSMLSNAFDSVRR